jgi:hypothetical protein
MSADSIYVAGEPGPEKSVSLQRPTPQAVLHVASAVNQAVLPSDVCRPGIARLAFAELDNLVSKLCRASNAYHSGEDKLSGNVNPSAELALKMRQIRSGFQKKFEWKAVMKDEPSLCFRDPFPPEPMYGTVLSTKDGDESLLNCDTDDVIAPHATLDSTVEVGSSVQEPLWSCPEVLSPNRKSHYEYCKVDFVLLSLSEFLL